MGNSIASNMFMLGYAYQKGLLPLGHEAINKAIEMNGASVDMNKTAFVWGRRASVDLPAVERLLKSKAEKTEVTEPVEYTVDSIKLSLKKFEIKRMLLAILVELPKLWHAITSS